LSFIRLSTKYESLTASEVIVARTKKMQEECCDAPIPAVVATNFPDDLAALAKAVGHPARVRILSLLVKKGVCISGDLVDELPLAPSTVSEHLRILRKAGLIQGTVDGPRRCYCVNKEALRHFLGLVTTLCREP
jgi:ArsR family transcriptional regulator